MRKLLIILSILLSVGVFLVTFFGMRREGSAEYYSIPEAKSYVAEEGRRMTFDVYSTKADPVFSYPDSCIYSLILDSSTLLLKDVSVEKMDSGSMTDIKISASLPDTDSELTSLTSKLAIQAPNGKYTFTYGSFSVLNPNLYPLLSLNTLYGSFFYRNGMLYLGGIDVTLTKSYSRIVCLRVGGYAYANLSHLTVGSLYENVFVPEDIGYNPYSYSKIYEAALQDKIFFAPIGYKNLEVIRSGYLIVILDDEKYYVDEFSYMTSLNFDMYESIKIKGDVSNA